MDKGEDQMIASHQQIPHDYLLRKVERYEKSWGIKLDAVRHRPADSLGTQLREALKFFAMTVAGNLEKTRITRALAIADGIGVANFMFATHIGKTFSVRLPEASFELTGQPITAYTDLETWLKAYFCAVTARDIAGVRALCAVPEDIHRQADLKPDAAGLAIVRVFKGLHNSDASMGQLLIEAMEASQVDRLSDDRRDYVTNIMAPLLPIVRCILSPDQGEFNEKLEEAVYAHKAFWSSDQNMDYDTGWVSLPLLGVSAIAFDAKGFSMTFETDYVPAWLARGDL
jgi:hypothetical protein